VGALADALAFPSPRPADVDGLARGLHDLSWLPPGAVAVGVRGADVLWHTAPRAAGAVIERWLEAAERWSVHGRALHLLFFWRPDADR
jgi:hypothetical protein